VSDEEFVGFTPTRRRAITYYLKKRTSSAISKAEIYDAQGKLSRRSGEQAQGLNRIEWPMRLHRQDRRGELDHRAAGRLLRPAGSGRHLHGQADSAGSEALTGQVELVPDPRSPHSAADRALQQKDRHGALRACWSGRPTSPSVAHRQQQGRRWRRGCRPKDGCAQGHRDGGGRLGNFHKKMVATGEAGWLAGEVALREKLATSMARSRYEGAFQIADRSGDRPDGRARPGGEGLGNLVDHDVAAVKRDLAGRKLPPVAVPLRSGRRDSGGRSRGGGWPT